MQTLASHSVVCFLCCAEALSLLQLCLSIFASVACSFCVLSNKSLPRSVSQRISLMFLSRWSTVLAYLMVKTWEHFSSKIKSKTMMPTPATDFLESIRSPGQNNWTKKKKERNKAHPHQKARSEITSVGKRHGPRCRNT